MPDPACSSGILEGGEYQDTGLLVEKELTHSWVANFIIRLVSNETDEFISN